MNIEFNPVNFTVSEEGELKYHGKVITVHNEFRYLSKEQKLDILFTFIDWANDEIKTLNV
jgi:hypothetical protein